MSQLSRDVALMIGNPQSLKQQPITFLRQVLSMVINPALVDSSADLVRKDRMVSPGLSSPSLTCPLVCLASSLRML